MTSPDERADSRARNAAITLVHDALKAGRIVQPDHDMRVAQLESAQTMQDIDLQVRDLRAPAPVAPVVVAPVAPTPTGVGPSPAAPVSVASAGQPPWPLVNYGPPHTPGSTAATEIATAVGRSGRAVGGVIAAIVLVSVVTAIAGGVIAFVSARNSLPDFPTSAPSDETTYLPGQAPGKDGVNLHTVEGYQAMVDALKEQSGTTYTFSAVLYPRYAVLEVPTGTNTRYQNFYWDGRTMELQDFKGSSSDGQVDLSLVDPRQMVTMLETVRGRIDEPSSWYVVIGAMGGGDAQVSAYASNDFNESTYLIEGLDGTVVYDSAAQG